MLYYKHKLVAVRCCDKGGESPLNFWREHAKATRYRICRSDTGACAPWGCLVARRSHVGLGSKTFFYSLFYSGYDRPLQVFQGGFGKAGHIKQLMGFNFQSCC